MNATYPFGSMLTLAEEMRRFLDEFPPVPGHDTWPPVDIRVDGEEVTLTAELAGVRREDVQLEVEGRHLTLRAEKPAPQLDENQVAVHRERRFGKFERTFELGFEVDRDQIAAELTNGVLRIRLPKAEAAKPRRIAVTTTPLTLDAPGN